MSLEANFGRSRCICRRWIFQSSRCPAGQVWLTGGSFPGTSSWMFWWIFTRISKPNSSNNESFFFFSSSDLYLQVKRQKCGEKHAAFTEDGIWTRNHCAVQHPTVDNSSLNRQLVQLLLPKQNKLKPVRTLQIIWWKQKVATDRSIATRS